MDLAFGIHLKGLLVLVGDGQGRFRAWTRGIGLEIPGQGGDASTFSSRVGVRPLSNSKRIGSPS